jgi:hypothetical protein
MSSEFRLSRNERAVKTKLKRQKKMRIKKVPNIITFMFNTNVGK